MFLRKKEDNYVSQGSTERGKHSGQYGHPNSLVIGFVAVHVRDAVHKEGHIKGPGEAHIKIDPERHPEILLPEVPGYRHWHNDRDEREKRYIVFALEHDNPIGLQVGHIDNLTLLDNLRMRRQKQPANVSKEETPLGIMWIRVCL